MGAASSGGGGNSSGVGKAPFTEQASTSSTSFDYAADVQAAGASSGIYVGETGAQHFTALQTKNEHNTAEQTTS